MTIMNKMSVGLAGAAASPISPLTVEVTQETNDRLHIKIYDPNNQRWEVPTRYTYSGMLPLTQNLSLDLMVIVASRVWRALS